MFLLFTLSLWSAALLQAITVVGLPNREDKVIYMGLINFILIF